MAEPVLRLSLDELAILREMSEMGFGEIPRIDRPASAPPHAAHSVTEKQAAFIRTLKQVGQLDQVVVHQGQPVEATYRQEYPVLGKVKRKVRF